MVWKILNKIDYILNRNFKEVGNWVMQKPFGTA
jgi:hypothetical protein